jgi:hypothetical protein
LANLLYKNGIDVFSGAEHKKLNFVWKHGYPHDYLKLLNEKVINIFIIRDLEEWLVSMFNNVHNIALPIDCSFQDFLVHELIPIGYINKKRASFLKNGKLENYMDYRKDIFEIRYEKIKSYLAFSARHKDIVYVKLDYIQDKNNCYHFLNELNKYYGLGITNIIPEIKYNLKTGEPGKKSKYDTIVDEECKKIIRRLKNDRVEEWIDNLTFEMS